ncbi:HNH endonuclease [Rhodococcus tibetensis]|uniref:HNH endonuclease n=1 Tax=Rhodococcus tibetensis TaxID=2965064 RepID=A0ABT1QDT2_9NOCA|nr:HNH endonuclease signature motif containing protein [Rhodococcus sp. FXJ9.536]MCQ4120416.1 HNH endonuclease [Rhodococcus sp. FXJ9.536]
MTSWSGREAQTLTRLTLETYGTVCHLCGGPGATTADHVIPRKHGGLNVLANLRPAHRSCNSARGAMLLAEWFATRRYAAAVVPPSRQW